LAKRDSVGLIDAVEDGDRRDISPLSWRTTAGGHAELLVRAGGQH
jgi:hypothetical protein